MRVMNFIRNLAISTLVVSLLATSPAITFAAHGKVTKVQPSAKKSPAPSVKKSPAPSAVDRSQEQPSIHPAKPTPKAPSHSPATQPSVYSPRPAAPFGQTSPQIKPAHPTSASPAVRPQVRPRPTATPSHVQPPGPGQRDLGRRQPLGKSPGFVPREPISVAPTLTRSGRNFDQKVVVRGNQTIVERRYTGPSGVPRHGSGHHDHHYEGVRYYHRHFYGHHYYHCYVHYWTYDPWFWGFYFTPFPAPWHYTWVWVGSPWYVTWGWYYQPYPVYVAPSYWVTDYVVSRSLEEEYNRGYLDGQQAAQQQAGQQQQAVSGAPISEEIKETLRQQVDETAKAFQAEQAVALEQALQKPDYLFIVDTPMSVTDASGMTCSLSGGDIIQPAASVDPNTPVAKMRVVTSKGQECPAGSEIHVALTDLQEMLNSFGQKVDDGMEELKKSHAPETTPAQ